jgi:tRNA/rRNA methyltransferase
MAKKKRPAMRAATMTNILRAKTDTTPMKTRFILLNTSHAGNVGATARAMKVMGFTDLVLVAPRWGNVLRREETIQRASGALDVLANARVVATLDEAIEGLHHLCATAMTPRDFGPPTLEPRPHFAALAAEHGQNADFGVGFLFGSERFGMLNDDVYRCHTCLSIPTDPKFGSLNLAAAVQVLAYDWREALGGLATMMVPTDCASVAVQEPTPLADAQQLAGLLDHWQQSLMDIGFLDPEAPKKLMPRLNQLFNRAQVTQEEIHILRGIAKTMSQVAKTAAEKSSG